MSILKVSTDVDNFMQSADNAGMRTALELGASDTVEFGAFIPPAGTTAEIDAVTGATVGQVMVDTDKKTQVRFTSASTYENIGASPVPDVYLVNPVTGDDVGGGGATPFRTIGGAIDQAIVDAPLQAIIQCQTGVYSVNDATYPQAYVASTASLANFYITFDEGAVVTGSGTLIDNTAGNLSLLSIGGNMGIATTSGSVTLYNGAGPSTGSQALYISFRALVTATSNSFNDIVICTGGRIIIDAGSFYSPTSIKATTNPRMFLVTGGELVVQNLEIDCGGSLLAEKGYVVKVETGARAILLRCRCNEFSLAHQTATDSFVLLEDCLHSSTRASDVAVKADIAATNLYLKGGNFSKAAAGSNTALVTTFGTFTVSNPSVLIWQP